MHSSFALHFNMQIIRGIPKPNNLHIINLTTSFPLSYFAAKHRHKHGMPIVFPYTTFYDSKTKNVHVNNTQNLMWF